MWGNKSLPKFGPLAGLKVAHATQSVAGPFGPQLLADYGADVLWIENALVPDVLRFSSNYVPESERRNQRTLALNIPSPEGKEIFRRVIEGADVFVESYKGGQMDKWGLSDEVLWEVNPRLVICHISGFGQTGLSDYVGRPSYDMIAQAFSGYTYGNGTPDVVFPTGPYAADYMTATFAAIGILAAVYNARNTGKGESVDIAQSEVMMKVQLGAVDWLTRQKPVDRAGFPQPQACVGCFRCKDGEFVQVALAGGGIIKKALAFVDIDPESEPFRSAGSVLFVGTEAGDRFQEAVLAYLASHTSDEAHAEMVAAGLTAQKVNTWRDVEKDPQVAARGVIQELTSFKGHRIRYIGAVPRFKNNPGRTWRQAPWMGMDNEEILGELGYSPEDVVSLYEKKIISHDPEMKLCFPYERPGA